MPSTRVDMLKKQKESNRKGTIDTRDVKDLPINKMERDRVMTRMIKDGKASDKGLKREAEAIQREHEQKRRERAREYDQQQLYQMKKEYGLLPEQLRRGR